FLHGVRDRIHDGRVERLKALDGPAQLAMDGLREIRPLRLVVEDVLAEDRLARLLQVGLRGCDLDGRDLGDGRLTCGHVTPVAVRWRDAGPMTPTSQGLGRRPPTPPAATGHGETGWEPVES